MRVPVGWLTEYCDPGLGSDATTLNFQVGANTTANDTVSIKTSDMTNDSTITAVTGSARSASIVPGHRATEKVTNFALAITDLI